MSSIKFDESHRKHNWSRKILPRIINKLTICAYPMAIIRPEVSEITGLDNYNLSGQAPFNIKTGELLNCFPHYRVVKSRGISNLHY